MKKENVNEGWICLYRNIRNHFLYPSKENRPFTKYEAWVDLLLNANHAEQKVVLKFEMYIVQRGEQLRTLKTLSELWNWTPSTVRRFLTLLENQKMICLKSDTKSTLITICNYDVYQGDRKTDEIRQKNDRKTDEKRQDINNNGYNEKKDNNGEEKYPAQKIEDFIRMFQEAYRKIIGIPYVVDKEKDFSGAERVLDFYQQAEGNGDEIVMQAWLEAVINHPDNFHKKNMTLTYLANNFNAIHNSRLNHKHKNEGATMAEIVAITTKHFGTDSPGK